MNSSNNIHVNLPVSNNIDSNALASTSAQATKWKSLPQIESVVHMEKLTRLMGGGTSYAKWASIRIIKRHDKGEISQQLFEACETPFEVRNTGQGPVMEE